MDEDLRFIARLLEGGKMAPLCRESGISRVTGYKIYERYKTCGLEGLSDRSRRPLSRHANQLPYQVERRILGIKKEHPSWGAPSLAADQRDDDLIGVAKRKQLALRVRALVDPLPGEIRGGGARA